MYRCQSLVAPSDTPRRCAPWMSMSSTSHIPNMLSEESKMESVELKAGHLPATKAGNMRVTRKDRTKSETENATPTTEVNEGGSSDEVRVTQNVLAGTDLAAQANKAYPEEAVKHFHTKPVVSHPNKQAMANVPDRDRMQRFQPQPKHLN